MSQVMVTKRDGSVEDFKVEKVKRCINWACEGLQVNPLALESRFNEYLQEEVSSTSIQESLVFCARSLATLEESDWIFVAGRLFTMERWKNTGAYDVPFEQFLRTNIENGNYKCPVDIYDHYTEEQMKEAGSWIDKERDMKHSFGSIYSLSEKALGNFECVQQMMMVNALIIASKEAHEHRMKFAKEVYEAASRREMSLASPWLQNLRFGKNISSCFIIDVQDNLESIFDNVKRAAMISKNGGGLGCSLGRVRAKNSEINGVPEASKGVCGWARILNDTALFVDQGGKRAGAFTIHVPAWHRDIEDFLEIQSETGDLRTKAYDIFPQVGVHDYFMELDAQDGDNLWHTFCPHETESKIGINLNDVFGSDFKRDHKKCVKAYEKGILTNVKVFKVRNLVKLMMKPMFESGLPYVAFLDTINNDNPNDHEGTIPCVNLCNEQFSNVVADKYAHTCNLVSIVAGRVKDNGHLEYLSRLCTRVLDNGIELTNPPTEISKAHNERYRTIGVGIQGLADYLAKHYKFYENTQFIQEFAEVVQYGCVKESIELAKERGCYPAFEGSRWDTGKQIKKYAGNSTLFGKAAWNELQEEIDKYGIRNSQLTSPAPNTSTAIFMDATAGVVPHYAGFFKKGNGNGKYHVAGMYLKDNPLFYAKNASRYKHTVLVDSVAAIQKFVDSGISSEYIFDHNQEGFSAKQLYDLVHYAWKKKTKAIYYIRHIKKGKSLSDVVGIEDTSCEGCAD